MQPDHFTLVLEELLEEAFHELPGEEVTPPGRDPEALAEVLDAAELRQQEVQLVQEMLVNAGGVSREMVQSFQNLLPAPMVLESFTAQVTRTGYTTVTEGLGTVLKVAAAAGVVALLGTVGYIIYRIVKFRKRLPNSKMDKKLTAMINTAEEKLRTAVNELRDLYPEVEHRDLQWSREEGLVLAATTTGCQEIDVPMLEGKYQSLVEKTGKEAMAQAQAIEKFFKSAIFPELDKLMRAGTDKDVESVAQKLLDYQLDDLVGKHLEAFGHEKQLSFKEPKEVVEKFRERYSVPIAPNDIKSRLGHLKVASTLMDEGPVQLMFKAQGIMVGLTDSIGKYEKRLNGSKELPAGYVDQVKELLKKCRPPLESLADLFTIAEIEVGSHKRCSKIKAAAVANGFKAVSEYYQEKAKADKDNAKVYRQCVAHLRKLFDPIADALKS